MNITDELLERLGVYFVYHKVHEKRGITFEAFVNQRIKELTA